MAFLALGSVAAGIFDLLWQEFEPAHQPIQALGDHIPAQRVLACLAAIWLVGGGLALLPKRTSRFGAAALAGIYLVFALFWVPRFVTVPRILGVHPAVYIGLLDGFATQFIVVIAAVLLFSRHTDVSPGSPLSRTSPARWMFGLCAIVFGLGHLTAIPVVSTMIPRWMPASPALWVVLSGIAFCLAGLAIVSGVQDLLAGRLLALMFLVFSLLVLVPLPVATPHNHVAWGANAYNLAAVGATLIFAAYLGDPRTNSPAASPLVNR